MIIDFYRNGNSALKISKIFKVSSPTILKVLNKHGVTRKVGEGSIRYSVDLDYFKTIDTQEKAYWLGFLYADGCVTKRMQFKLTLKREDEEHLRKFMKAIKYSGEIKREAKDIKGKKYELSTISVRRKDFCKNLIDKGCMYKKTELLKFPDSNILPNHLVSHFIRGYFDGDGSITINHTYKKTNKINYKISIAGTNEMLTSIKNFLGKNNLKLHNRKTYFVLDITGNNQLLQILDSIIYKDAEIYLERKYLKYIKFKNTLIC